MSPEYLTIHSTSNLSSKASGERSWLASSDNTREASFHVIVDEMEVIECLPFNEIARWHASDGSSGTGNTKSIALEIAESGDRVKTLRNAILLSAKVMIDYNWDISKLKTHNDWATDDKVCPRILLDEDERDEDYQTWDWFKREVKQLI